MQRHFLYQQKRKQRFGGQPYFLFVALLIGLTACSGEQDGDHISHQEHTIHDQYTAKTEEDDYLSKIAKSTNKYVISDQKTIKVSAEPGEYEFSGTGYIRNDERRNIKVAARFGGRIEELQVKFNYAYVRKGEPILELYSPVLNTLQQELRYLRLQPEDTALLKQARQRLRLLGLSDMQIQKLEGSKTPKLTVQIESPAEGYALFAEASAAPLSEVENTDQGDGMGSMNGGNAGTSSPQVISGGEGTLLRKGKYVKAGQTLFAVNDFKVVWAIISVDARHQARLKAGTPVKVYSELQPGKSTTGKIDLVEPVYEPGHKFVEVRVYLPNKDLRFKANSLVTATIAGSSKEVLAVPNSAVMDLGRKKIVWVMTGKTPSGKKMLEAREVKIGSITALSTEIISGLKAGQEIASDAGMLADSESFIDAAVN